MWEVEKIKQFLEVGEELRKDIRPVSLRRGDDTRLRMMLFSPVVFLLLLSVSSGS